MKKKKPAIYLAQLLCPQRHAIIATPYLEGIPTDEVEKIATAKLKEMGVNWRCGICGSTELHWEHGKTKFASGREAFAKMIQSTLEQAVTRMKLDELGVTHDSQRLRNN